MRLAIFFAALGLAGCTTAPPPSRLPNAQAAIDRMRSTASCGNALSADAKLDYFSTQEGRIRTKLLFVAARPANMRADIFVTTIGSVGTLTTDGKDFQATDLRQHQFLSGPASACNIARITHIPIPGFVLVTLLRGRAPVLKHDAPGLAAPTIEWDGGGHYVVKISGNNDATEEIHLVPQHEDWAKTWEEQRMRVVDIVVRQRGVVLYHAEIDSHEPAPMSAGRIVSAEDALLGMLPSPPSGPMCTAEIPRRIRVEVPSRGVDALFRYDKVEWNPPLEASTFTQQSPPGLTPVRVDCQD